MKQKLDKEHVDLLTDLQQSYQEIARALGNLAIDEIVAQTQLDSIQLEKLHFTQQFKDLQTRETQLINQLKERYGEGQIDLTDGTFTESGQ
jgi:predicted transcriptional regulator